MLGSSAIAALQGQRPSVLCATLWTRESGRRRSHFGHRARDLKACKRSLLCNVTRTALGFLARGMIDIKVKSTDNILVVALILLFISRSVVNSIT